MNTSPRGSLTPLPYASRSQRKHLLITRRSSRLARMLFRKVSSFKRA